MSIRGIPEGFERHLDVQSAVGPSGERLASQRFINTSLRATVIVAIQEQGSTSHVLETSWRPSAIKVDGIAQLFEYDNGTELKANGLGWFADSKTLITVTSREIQAPELASWVRRLEVTH